MGAPMTKLGRLVRDEPAQAGPLILRALEQSLGKAAGAAESLGVTRREFDRWVQRLGLEAQVQEIRYDGRAWMHHIAAGQGKRPEDARAFAAFRRRQAKTAHAPGALEAWIASMRTELTRVGR
jgi:hypothetical protein